MIVIFELFRQYWLEATLFVGAIAAVIFVYYKYRKTDMNNPF